MNAQKDISEMGLCEAAEEYAAAMSKLSTEDQEKIKEDPELRIGDPSLVRRAKLLHARSRKLREAQNALDGVEVAQDGKLLHSP